MENIEHTPSQVINAPAPTMENPSITPEPPKQEEPKPAKLSATDAINKAFDEAGVEDKDDGDDDKPVVEAKAKTPEPKVDPVKDAKTAEPVDAKAKQDEAEERAEKTKRELRSESLRAPPPPPARLLPAAREKWTNVPQEVKFEVHRVLQEAETEIAQYKEHQQFREELKPFEEEAKASGTTVKEALTNYVTMEKALRSDPAQGFRQLLSNMQMRPQQAISHILSAFNVTPQALAQHISQNPHEYTALAAPRQQQFDPQQPAQQTVQTNPEVKALQEQLNAMRAEQVQNSIVNPFREEYPEYDEHEAAIAEVLKSGIIERIHGNGLSPRDKLEVALGMVAPHALRQSSLPHGDIDQQVQVPASRDTSPVVDLRGTKSIKGAPHGVETDRRRKMSKEDAINAAMASFAS